MQKTLLFVLSMCAGSAGCNGIVAGIPVLVLGESITIGGDGDD